jgi:hypothetical protein
VAIAVPHLKPIVAPPRWAKDDLWRKAQLVPSLDLNFAATKNLVDATTGAELVTFTRASSGTYVDSQGVIQIASTDEPRFDHDPTTGESLGLLVEEQRTNLLLRSEEFNIASWSINGITVTANTQIAPTGATTADTITTTSDIPILYQDVACIASTVYTFSFFVRLGTMPASDFRFAIRDNTGAAFIATDIVPNVTPVTTEWRRVSYTFTTPAGCVQVRPYLYRFAYTTGGTVHLWGAQLEAGA